MKKQTISRVSMAVLALSLAACGGGGGGGDAADPVLPQGLWDATEPAATVYILPAAANSGAAGEFWAIDASLPNAVLQGSLQVSGSSFRASAARYLTSDAGEAADAQVALVEGDNGPTLTVTGSALDGTQTISGLTSSPTYDRVATMADWQGCWALVGDMVDSTMCVSGAGVISGNRGACELAGTVSLRPEAKAVVDIQVQESECGEAENLGGIGVFARSSGTVVEDARMLALKNGAATNGVATRRSLIRLQRML